jgi:hypothetical protein
MDFPIPVNPQSNYFQIRIVLAQELYCLVNVGDLIALCRRISGTIMMAYDSDSCGIMVLN